MSYRSYADLGGREELGRIIAEPEGELFHAPWEARTMALVVAMGTSGLWNIDMSRAARETLIHYRELSYYEIWLQGLEKLSRSSGAVHERGGPAPAVLRAGGVAATLARGTRYSRTATQNARFALKQRVRTRAAQPAHHTRLPDYARGKMGVVERVHGAFVFADSNARGLGENPQWLYSVAFDARELWGEDAPDGGSVISVDAWESYLEMP
jgi:nitrile hydratase beta subunit